ncbi:hypothetical protein DICPUDRAFT_42477 [Dictyostelium purpureum]|uniref:Uncharacterized protein n=1 Tax=Dictyostelium purpureum TaxID=5786 RepID=F1A262_DICPU|nr:uncharacterized protein DICPUDRAFT_42477 [Dictyostelium purpureum]EGC29715.1 hypothetical protein DICPUDRAFT_42477 [Dictyostelium purpureum]|eukprot:XP_003293756.1 hypothetical protein DICPUDRAFT_42477 [Dictyostelium purpureum]
MSYKFIDIGSNLCDEMFQGKYNHTGKQYHEADLGTVLDRAWNNGMDKIIITSGRLSEVKESLELINKYDNGSNRLFTTIGVHPTRCSQELVIEGSENNEIKPDYIKELLKLYNENKDKVVAVGEFGLDYDRLQFCSKEIQIKCFEYQFILAEKTNLPLFLHLRNAAQDFIDIVKRNRSKFKYGVVHSFTGTEDELKQLLELDLYIGINGCSLKTEENLSVAAKIPIERLLIETDSPYCDIRKTHASYKYVKTVFPILKKEKFKLDSQVQGRNEPCNIINVLEVISGLKPEQSIEEISSHIYLNTLKIFFGKEN